MRDRNVIMIFGGGINQIELIREARKLGVVSVVIDPQPDPPGKAEADFFYMAEGSDYERTREIALRHTINGMVTGQMEKPLRMMARLAAELGIIFHSPEVIERSVDKWLMKDAFLKHDVACAKGILLKGGADITSIDISDLKSPLITKPRDAFSSRGVIKTDNMDDLEAHIAESGGYDSRGDVIVEEFLSGREYSVESVTFRGETTVVQITEKIITEYPYTVEMGHIQPAALTLPEERAIADLVKKAIASLGIDNSASHAEVMLTAAGPAMIEIGARLGGDFISSYLTKASTGISMDRAAVQVALGITPELTRSCERYSMIRYLYLPPGKKVSEVLSADEVMKLPGVIFAWTYIKQGDITGMITHSAQRPACVMAVADSRDECMKMTNDALQKLRDSIILI